jgi:hypothetical protein
LSSRTDGVRGPARSKHRVLGLERMRTRRYMDSEDPACARGYPRLGAAWDPSSTRGMRRAACRSQSPAPSGRGIFSGCGFHRASSSNPIPIAACVFVERAAPSSGGHERACTEGMHHRGQARRCRVSSELDVAGLGVIIVGARLCRTRIPSGVSYRAAETIPFRSTGRVRRGCGCRRRSVSSLVHEAWGASSARGACAGRDLLPPDPPAFKRARATLAAAGPWLL